MHHQEQYDESGQQLLRKLDKNITIAEYQHILSRTDWGPGDVEIHQVFNDIYQHLKASDKD